MKVLITTLAALAIAISVYSLFGIEGDDHESQLMVLKAKNALMGTEVDKERNQIVRQLVAESHESNSPLSKASVANILIDEMHRDIWPSSSLAKKAATKYLLQFQG